MSAAAAGIAPGQCRPCQPRSTEGDVRDRGLHRQGVRRPCRALRDCAHSQISYNSCRNRHCRSARHLRQRNGWRRARPICCRCRTIMSCSRYRRPSPISPTRTRPLSLPASSPRPCSAETLVTIAADPKRLGARVRHHFGPPYLGSGDDPSPARPHDHQGRRSSRSSGERWVACAFRLLLAGARANRPCSDGCSSATCSSPPTRPAACEASAITPLWPTRKRSMAYCSLARRPGCGRVLQAPVRRPQAVLAYLSRYTHRVAIANSRLIACDRASVTFRWKDYRVEGGDRRRAIGYVPVRPQFLIHVLPSSLRGVPVHRLLASGTPAPTTSPERVNCWPFPVPEGQPTAAAVDHSKPKCPCCGGRMIIIELFERGATPRQRPTGPTIVSRLDTS